MFKMSHSGDAIRPGHVHRILGRAKAFCLRYVRRAGFYRAGADIVIVVLNDFFAAINAGPQVV